MKKSTLGTVSKNTLSVTFSVMAIGVLTMVVSQRMPTEARMVSVVSSSSSSVSSRELNARERAILKRLQRKQLRSSASSASTPEVVVDRPSIRLMRQAAPVNEPESRANIIYEKAGCGDGLVLPPEQCDDGNKASADGCSSSCTLETGYTCLSYVQPTKCTRVCGDGMVAAAFEICDDGNTSNGDGCNQYCKKEPGFSCTSATPNICTFIPVCGNRMTEGSETCDDGNVVSGDGCSASCTVELE